MSEQTDTPDPIDPIDPASQPESSEVPKAKAGPKKAKKATRKKAVKKTTAKSKVRATKADADAAPSDGVALLEAAPQTVAVVAGDEEPITRTRTRTRTKTGDAPVADADAPVADADAPVVDVEASAKKDASASDADASEGEHDELEGAKSRRRGTRGGRGRTKAKDEVADQEARHDDASASDQTPERDQNSRDETGSDDASSPGRGRQTKANKRSSSKNKTSSDAADSEDVKNSEDSEDDGKSAEDRATEAAIAKGGTRMAAKRRGAGGSGGGRSSGGDRRGPRGISEETRRAILDGPPRTMLVTHSAERTQICVMEDRRAVEHYVTHAGDVTYVGNIYMARVQNVLPGMEAAFLDIGKGRNGVLYAGEVLYDEQDLEDSVPRIEDTLKPGQKLLVQVTKDPMGTKGPRLTQHLSLAGRYMVLAPNSDLFGTSRKLTDHERDRLRRIVKKVKPAHHGVIVRTAAENASEEALTADLERLLAKWEKVEEAAKDAKPMTAVYEEPKLVVKVIRDNFGPEFEKCIVDDPDLFEEVKTYLDAVATELVDKVQIYEPVTEGEHEKPVTLFGAYNVAEQLRKATDRKVWLPSGGYLIIETTEAMKVVDVNTGKFTGSKDTSLEEVVLKTNIEAAEEIVRQLRLRDMGGIIIIDFIDMLLKANQDQVIRRLKRELLRDRTKTRVSEVSRLGLVQMTRKNVSQGLVESFSTKCDHCNGVGRILDLPD
ncbi:MAG: Rne/Rng family ribonuclease [Glaciecola sp.]|jgi:Rne/Rng family ribonuclease